MSQYQQISEGEYLVDIKCPQCGTLAQLVADVGAVLKRTSDGEGTLAVRVKSKPADHVCGQTAITVDTATGELL